MATHLSRTCDATSGSGYSQKWTWSGWVKRGTIGSDQGIIGNKRDDNNTNSRFRLFFKSNDKLAWECKDSGGSDDSSFETNVRFRDTSAWYHITFIYDTANSTATERIKCYINGKDLRTEYGGFSSDNQASSGFGTLWSSAVYNYLGTAGNSSGIAMQFDGRMAHCHLTYGYRYEASTFGEFDSTSGIWKIKTSPSVTYGSQGYFLLKDNASVTDQSGEGNNYTATGTLTACKDNPSNNYATMNPQHNYYEGGTYAHCNNQITTGGSNKYTYNNSTIGVTKGKWYMEYKWISGGTDCVFGITDRHTDSSTKELGNDNKMYAFRANGTVRNSNGNYSPWSGTSYTTGDIIGVALDMDNHKLYFSKNGTWQNSGDPTSGSTGTGAVSISTSPRESHYWFSACMYDDAVGVLASNFGDGYFATTAISSEGSNGNGSLFEYDVPSGYYALNSKNLNTYG